MQRPLKPEKKSAPSLNSKKIYFQFFWWKIQNKLPKVSLDNQGRKALLKEKAHYGWPPYTN